MCGRFTRMYTWAQLYALYKLAYDSTAAPPKSNLQPRYNICPTTQIDVIRDRNGRPEIVSARWGLIPSWWRKPLKELPATFNARSDTVHQKPMFRAAFKSRRCIIPASGYYEWRKGEDGGREPHYFRRVDGAVISMAGLYEEWTDLATGEIVTSATIIVTDASEEVAHIHNRMPVILEQNQIEDWLFGKSGVEVLKPAPQGTMKEHRVSRRVNSSRADENDETLIEPE
ncbi:MAG: SOS response-associated peptidase [Xanthobacteraceae bacterium]|nr:SOS response-associated peptidase [Xanthobacteraceae bacterium]MCW5678720.1 SOS response-associated peptidase [Xanthobacteraceae bacterium]